MHSRYITVTGALAIALIAPMAWGVAENTPDACRDAVDNDADGFVDCADQDCSDLVFCDTTTAAGASAENTPDACRDAMDNDADGFVDCADQDCSDLVFCDTATAGGGSVTHAAPTGPAPKATLPEGLKLDSPKAVGLLLGDDVGRAYGRGRGVGIAGSVLLGIGAVTFAVGAAVGAFAGLGAFTISAPGFVLMDIAQWLLYSSVKRKATALIDAGLPVRLRKGLMVAGNAITTVLVAGGFGLMVGGAASMTPGLIFGGLGTLCGALLIGSIMFLVGHSKTSKSIVAELGKLASGNSVASRVQVGVAPVKGGAALSLSGAF